MGYLSKYYPKYRDVYLEMSKSYFYDNQIYYILYIACNETQIIGRLHSWCIYEGTLLQFMALYCLSFVEFHFYIIIIIIIVSFQYLTDR